MPLSELFVIASRFRTAVEAVPVQLRPIGLQEFPHGSCGDACLLLGAHFVDLGIEGFNYICGERGSRDDNTWTTHAWLQRGSCVVDITADQFTHAPSPVVVADPSPWHVTFSTDTSNPSDFRVLSGHGADLLQLMYSRVNEWLSTNDARP